MEQMIVYIKFYNIMIVMLLTTLKIEVNMNNVMMIMK
ncbi:hypothetical protein J2S19_004588 [Metabacillus malikii]|uniref:NADH dehydrogenase subunit 6 n=1 Tax=Metabacillus malikii TaxID=1504265 RepID=A0ABT9ZLS7_9BACI|nr:hypothetical protein [Metabacillus malikii]